MRIFVLFDTIKEEKQGCNPEIKAGKMQIELA